MVLHRHSGQSNKFWRKQIVCYNICFFNDGNTISTMRKFSVTTDWHAMLYKVACTLCIAQLLNLIQHKNELDQSTDQLILPLEFNQNVERHPSCTSLFNILCRAKVMKIFMNNCNAILYKVSSNALQLRRWMNRIEWEYVVQLRKSFWSQNQNIKIRIHQHEHYFPGSSFWRQKLSAS